jgi:hypothetical protein
MERVRMTVNNPITSLNKLIKTLTLMMSLKVKEVKMVMMTIIFSNLTRSHQPNKPIQQREKKLLPQKKPKENFSPHLRSRLTQVVLKLLLLHKQLLRQ